MGSKGFLCRIASLLLLQNFPSLLLIQVAQLPRLLLLLLILPSLPAAPRIASSPMVSFSETFPVVAALPVPLPRILVVLAGGTPSDKGARYL